MLKVGRGVMEFKPGPFNRLPLLGTGQDEPAHPDGQGPVQLGRDRLVQGIMFGPVEVGLSKNLVVTRLGFVAHGSLLKYRSRE
jgi:hypothetical protein